MTHEVEVEVLDALRLALNTIEHRDGLKHRMDLFTADERNKLRTALAHADENIARYKQIAAESPVASVRVEARRLVRVTGERVEFNVDELIRHDESRTDEKLRQMIAAADSEADGNDGREPGDTRDEESLEDHNIQGLGAYRDVFDAGGEQ